MRIPAAMQIVCDHAETQPQLLVREIKERLAFEWAHADVFECLAAALRKQDKRQIRECMRQALANHRVDVVRILQRHNLCAPWARNDPGSPVEAAALDDVDLLARFEIKSSDALSAAIRFDNVRSTKWLLEHLGPEAENMPTCEWPHPLCSAAITGSQWALDLLLLRAAEGVASKSRTRHLWRLHNVFDAVYTALLEVSCEQTREAHAIRFLRTWYKVRPDQPKPQCSLLGGKCSELHSLALALGTEVLRDD
jgi:hypothetical protein